MARGNKTARRTDAIESALAAASAAVAKPARERRSFGDRIALFGFAFAGGGGLLLGALVSSHRPNDKRDTHAPRVSWRLVFLMWLVTPLALVLAWLLWRDAMPLWAMAATLPMLLALTGTIQGLRQLARPKK